MSPAVRRYIQKARAENATATAQRILAATQTLLMERWYDEVTLADIARHAGVTTKTVQRRFGSKEKLAREFFLSLGQENVTFRNSVPAGDPTVAVTAIMGMYEAQGDAIIRYLALEHRIPLVAEVIEMGRKLHRQWITRIFAPLLSDRDRDRTLALLVVATDVYTWKLLRRDGGLSRAATTKSMLDIVRSALAVPAPKEHS